MMPSRFSALLASSRPSPTNSTSSSSPSPAAPAYAPHHPYHPSLSLSHLHLNEQQSLRNYGEAAMPSAGEEGGGRGGQGQGSLAGGGRAGFFLPPSAAGYDDDDGRDARRRFSLATSEDAEVPQLDEVRGGGEGGWFSPVQRIQQQQGEQYTYAAPRSYGAHSRQATYQTLDALLAASSSASSSAAYTSYAQQQQQQGQQHDTGIGGDFSFASSFGLAEEGSPTVAPEDVSPLSPSGASLFEQQEYFSPALSSADVGGGGGSFFGSAPAYQPVQHHHKQQQAYHPPTYLTSSSSSTAPIPLSRPTAAPIGAFLPPTSRETLSESPYQPFAFSPSSFTHSAPSSAPAAYPAQSHSLTGAFLPPPAKGSGAPSTSTFASSAASNFSTLSAPSVPLAGSSLLAFATPAPAPAPNTSFPHSHSGPGILASYRRATYSPSSYSPSLTNASPPSPPRSSGSLLAAAFGPSPLIGTSAAGDLGRYNNTPPSPVESFLSPGSPPVVRGFAPSSAPAASSSSRPYPPITSSSSSSATAPSKRKKRSSSSVAASSSFLDDAYDPDYDDDEAAKLRNRPISPITGKPTKIIAKRGWPPKDAAKRVYRCEVEGCGKSFGRPSAKETHMRSHTGAKPFICPVPSCSRAFGVFSNLKRHMIVHPTVDFRSVSVHDLPLIQWVDDPDDPNGAGGRLEWIDEIPQGGSSSVVAAEGEAGEGEEGEMMED